MKKLTIVFALIFGLLAAGASAQNTDGTAPEIREVSVTPESVDVRDSAQTVTFFVRATDAGSGVSNVDLQLFPSSTDYILTLSLQRISGDQNDGIYSGFITIPAGATSQTWLIVAVTSLDAAGNRVYISGNQFVQRGFAASFQVISNSLPFKRRKRVRFL